MARDHNGQFVTINAIDRFLSKIYYHPSGCWEWTGWKNKDGYGMFDVTSNTKRLAHRYSYSIFLQDLQSAITLDHSCKNIRCVNPLHLEPMSAKENGLKGNTLQGINKRKTHCIRGHAFSSTNTLTHYKNKRVCRECRHIYWQKYQKSKQNAYPVL